MKKENTVENTKANGEPELYTGLTTKKWDKDFLPVCIMVISLVLFVIVSLNIHYEKKYIKTSNYIYYIDHMGKIHFTDGALILFFMMVALICYFMKFNGWALGVETIAVIIVGYILSMIISEQRTEVLIQFVCIFLCVIASEISLIWNLLIQFRKKKGR